MRIKSVMQKAAPRFAEHGLALHILGPKHYVFATEDNKIAFVIDTGRYRPHDLRVQTGGECCHFDFDNLRPSFFPKVPMDLHTQTQEAFEISFLKLTDQTIEILLPYLYVMRENAVGVTRELREALAKDTVGRAHRFAEKWSLPLEDPPKEWVKGLDGILRGMQVNYRQRKEEFLAHREDVLDLTAYWGELSNIRKQTPGQWLWSQWYEGQLEPCYVPKAHEFYDILERVLAAWNHGGEIINYGLDGLSI